MKNTMQKLVALGAAFVMAVVLVACGKSATLSVETDNQGIHAVATNGAEGSGNGHISIEEGYGLCVNHIVNGGSFHVKATDASGAVVFDEDITDNIADLVPVTGEIDVVISAQDADGTVDIIAYDVEAQAQADATLPEALESVGAEGVADAN